MAIRFMEEQIDSFITDLEEELALWNWNRLKRKFPLLSKKYFDDDEKKGVDFLLIAQTRVKEYLHGLEDDIDYNKWRVIYGEICFIVNKYNIDEDKWNREILEERLWPPYLRIDILAGIVESCLHNSESQKFYAVLEKETWQ